MVKANHYEISSFPDGTPLIKKDLTINYLNVIRSSGHLNPCLASYSCY